MNPFDNDNQPLLNPQNPPQPTKEFSTMVHNSDPRPKNWPKCKPILHHDISTDIIDHDAKILVRKAYFGWFVHMLGLLYNFCVMFGAVIRVQSILGFFLALIGLVVGIPLSFWVYWILYTANRTESSMYFVLWFILFSLQIILEILYALGLDYVGGGGLLQMISLLAASQLVLGIMSCVCIIYWAMSIAYSIFILYSARTIYKNLGGNQKALKDLGSAAYRTGMDHKEDIKQFAVDHKEDIKQFAIDHKEDIKQFAVDNKDAIVEFAKNHKEDVRDVVYDNRETVASVFKEELKK